MIMQDGYKKVLIYKRTHRGDPGPDGIFGVHDCMGMVRDREYDAVIGVGGVRPWSGDEDIARKVNWVGIGPKKHKSNGRGPLVTFDKYILLDSDGPFLEKIAPRLYRHMYIDSHIRVLMSYSLPETIQREIKEILRLAEESQPSRGLVKTGAVKNTLTKRSCGCQ